MDIGFGPLFVFYFVCGLVVGVVLGFAAGVIL